MTNYEYINEDKNDYMSEVTKLFSGDSRLSFSTDKNLSRLEQQSNGDLGFYFLAILSFIEGFLREKYKDTNPAFDFDNPTSISLPEMIDYVKENMPTGLDPTREREQIKYLDYLFNFMRTHSDIEKYYDKKLHQTIITKQPTEFYVDGDRIRHCFTEQSKENLTTLMGIFYEFTKMFDFYDTNKDCIDRLYTDERFFGEKLNHNHPKNTSIPKETHKIIVDAINNGTDEEKKQAIDIFSAKQIQMGVYAKSWRDYQKNMSTLTEEQQEISNEILTSINKNKTIIKLIKGGPGTGKTLILINLLQQSIDKNIMLLTYTKSLTKYNKFLSNLVCFNKQTLSTSDKEKLISKIDCFDEYFINLAKKILGVSICYLEDINIPEIKAICSKYEITKEVLIYEAKEIWLNLPSTKQSYLDLTYAQQTPLPKEDQKFRETHFWDAVSDLEKVFYSKSISIYPLELFFYKYQDGSISIPNDEKPDYLFIDEIQDLEKSKIESIRRISKKGFILTGDLSQSVFVRKGLPWKWINENKFPIPEQKLTKNFRSTEPIQTLANEYRKVIRIKDDDKEYPTISEGFMPGPAPEIYLSKSKDIINAKIKERIQFFKEYLYFDDKDFCIVGANSEILDGIKEKITNTISLEEGDFNFDQDSIKLSRIKYVKGIDIPIIMLVLDQSFLDRNKNDNLDIYGQENSIFTCLSRAMNILNIFFIDDGKILNKFENNDKQNAIFKLYNIVNETTINLDE